FYQFNWKESAIDPVGTYFSETDLFADGGNTAYSAQPALAAVAPFYNSLSPLGVGGLVGGRNISADGTIKVASVGPDINAKNDGQYGIAFRYIAEELNSTEFGAYFVNYHAKEPTIAADLGRYAGLTAANTTAIAGAITPAITNAVASQYAARFGYANANAFLAALQGGTTPPGVAAAFSNSVASSVTQAAGGIITADVANQVNAHREYSEDIRMYGFSFNTTLGDASVFGELAYRPNLPIGIATTNDLLGDLLRQAPALARNQTVNIGGQQVALGDEIHNVERVEAFNTSLGTIYNFGPVATFDSLFGVAELASEHLRGSDLKYTDFQGNTRYYSGRGNTSYISGGDRDDQVNKNAYGYTLVLSGTWNDVYAGVNVSPYVVYKDDFEGNSYQTGSFIEGRKAYTVGVKASYLNSLEGELAYTEFSGGGQNNSSRDRDNIGVNVKYSF
ncbi:MAG: DUF1302 family protein, partial [Pseudomonas sp.]|uniref:DUF1302 family protein n=1 Tax=Pseudomonas sp. TaxID=306 RepID=UPI0030F1F58C